MDEPFINQQHLDELEQLRTHIDEENGIKATHGKSVTSSGNYWIYAKGIN